MHASASSRAAWLRVVPLGGLGHIGGNMMAYETHEDMILVDCGVLFPSPEHPGINYLIPDIEYVVAHRHKLRGIVITHGHEDHIGALPFVLPTLPVPVWATRFTEALLEHKLGEHPQIKPDIRALRDRQAVRLGGFTVTPLAVTHSIPDAVALAIQCPAGTVLHTGDFKIDPEPLDGRHTDTERLEALGDEGVTLLVSDSTNAEKPGHTWSEREVAEVIGKLIAEAPARVFVTTFASHMDRLQTVLDAAAASGRRVMALGRSMQQNLAMGLERGFLRGNPRQLVDLERFEQVPRDKLVIVITGSQGEERSALARLVAGRLRPAAVEPGDRVIFSSRRIPGNERAIGEVVNALFRLGAEVIGDHQARVHSSGHGFNDEQRRMLDLCRPLFFLPVHGEYRHLVRHRELAIESGVDPGRTVVVEDGQPLKLARNGDDWTLTREPPVPAGLVFVDGKGIGDIGETVLRDRLQLAEGGVLACVLVYTREGKLIAGPYLATRGLVYLENNVPLLKRAGSQVRRDVVGLKGAVDDARINEAVRNTLRRFFKQELDRKPVILPVVVRVAASCCG